MQYSRFAVGDTPFCVWDWDLRRVNQNYIRQLNPNYFDYIARSHLAGLATEEDEHYAATALRMGYHHGLETLFSLLAATVQAPDCVVGWMQKYQIGSVRDIVRAITDEIAAPRNKFRLEKLSWLVLSELVHKYADFPTHNEDTKRAFALLWQKLADDFLNPSNDREYNSTKHGFRASAGGFALAVGIESSYGVSPPPEEMQVLSGTSFGLSYFVAENIGTSASKRYPHFQVVVQSRNWQPEAMVQALQLISMSVNNIRSFLSIINGEKAETMRFMRPEEPAAFDGPWSWPVGLLAMEWKTPIGEEQIQPFTSGEILNVYEEGESSQTS